MKKSGLSVPADESACNGVVGRRITTGRETLNQTWGDRDFLKHLSCDQLDTTLGPLGSRLVLLRINISVRAANPPEIKCVYG